MQLYSEEKARLMVKQAQLADRGAPAMVLLVLTAKDGEQTFSKMSMRGILLSLSPSSLSVFVGKVGPVVHSTLKLGIALLKEGNQRIQTVS